MVMLQVVSGYFQLLTGMIDHSACIYQQRFFGSIVTVEWIA
jgi:hypothetical protein